MSEHIRIDRHDETGWEIYIDGEEVGAADTWSEALQMALRYSAEHPEASVTITHDEAYAVIVPKPPPPPAAPDPEPEPVTMYELDLTGYGLSEVPEGWSQGWFREGAQFGVAEEKALVLTRGQHGNKDRVCKLDLSNGTIDFGFEATVRSNFKENHVIFVFRGSDPHTGYRLRASEHGQTQLRRILKGKRTDLLDRPGYDYDEDTLVHWRIECEGPVVRWKHWPKGDTEPESWVGEVEDPEPIGSGWIGMAARNWDTWTELHALRLYTLPGRAVGIVDELHVHLEGAQVMRVGDVETPASKGGGGREMLYAVTDSRVLAVADGRVTALAPGSAFVLATSEDGEAAGVQPVVVREAAS